MKTDLTAERLRDALSYNLDTGQFVWRLKTNKRIRVGAAAGSEFRGRIQIKLDGVTYRAHRLAWLWVHGEWPKLEIDHINGDPSDNRIANLRDVPPVINRQNQRRAQRRNHLGVLGVGRFRGGYRARIDHRHLGTFETIEAAQAAYVKAKRETHQGCTL